ncbi:MAG TPA: hypothetical protein VE981_19720 [Planctomycetota bacterium]|nr:hypothetical protein [Planctomycetota bacterium]
MLVRLPVPEAARLKDAEKSVRDLFKAEYAKKTPSDRQALATALLDQAARTSGDPAGSWVLYREAQDVAVQAGDPKLAVAAVDGAARVFDVDAPALKLAALSAIAKAAKTSDEIAMILDPMYRLVDDYIAADQYESADKASAAALALAKKGGQILLFQRAALRAREVSESKAKFQAMKGSLETLAKSPDDARANGEMGQFLCFVKARPVGLGRRSPARWGLPGAPFRPGGRASGMARPRPASSAVRCLCSTPTRRSFWGRSFAASAPTSGSRLSGASCRGHLRRLSCGMSLPTAGVTAVGGRHAFTGSPGNGRGRSGP